jgi:hypothetical protein
MLEASVLASLVAHMEQRRYLTPFVYKDVDLRFGVDFFITSDAGYGSIWPHGNDGRQSKEADISRVCVFVWSQCCVLVLLFT